MKKIITFSLLLLLFLSPKAQSFDVFTGDTLKFKGILLPIPFGYESLGLRMIPARSVLSYVFDKSLIVKFGINLLKWNASMIQEKENPLFNGEKTYGPLWPSLFNFYGQTYLLYYQYVSDDADSKMQIMLAKIDTTTLQPDPPKELFLLQQNTLGIFNSDDFKNDHRLEFKVSPDSSKILMLWSSATNRDSPYRRAGSPPR